MAAGDLRLMEPLSRHGGTAEVWLAAADDGRQFALKFLQPALERDVAGSALLAREHACLVAVRHPSIVATFGLSEHRGRLALVLEHLGGGDLVSLAGLPPRHWVRAASAVVTALVHVHSTGFVHRDVKLRNVLFDAQGRAVLADFGSAARAGERVPPGGVTAEYRPAAALRGGCADPREDVFALAVMLHELLHARLPPRLAAVGTRSAGSPTGGQGAVASLQALVAATLVADGRGRQGLSDFADVLESVAATDR